MGGGSPTAAVFTPFLPRGAHTHARNSAASLTQAGVIPTHSHAQGGCCAGRGHFLFDLRGKEVSVSGQSGIAYFIF